MNNKYFPLFSVFIMLFTIVVSDLLIFLFDSYSIIYSGYLILYFLGYSYIIFFSKIQLSFSTYIFFFLVLKCYVFFIAVLDSNYAIHAFGLIPDGDPVRYHINRAINRINDFQDIISHLFSPLNEFNGRLTHVLLYLYTKVLYLLGFDGHNIINIGVITYVINMLFNILTLFFIYIASLLYSASKNFARRSVFFLAFNPFFINYSASPRKEALLFLLLSIFLYILVDTVRNKKYHFLLLIFVTLLIAFERIYMIPLIMIIYMYLLNKIKYWMILSIVGVIFIEIFIGVHTAIGMYSAHVESLTNTGSSYLGNNHGMIASFLRTLFNPIFFRPFILNDIISSNILYYLQYFTYIIIYVISIKSFFYRKDLLGLIIISLAYVYFLIPFHSTFKIMLLTMFSTVFLDKISYIKFSRYN